MKVLLWISISVAIRDLKWDTGAFVKFAHDIRIISVFRLQFVSRWFFQASRQLWYNVSYCTCGLLSMKLQISFLSGDRLV